MDTVFHQLGTSLIPGLAQGSPPQFPKIPVGVWSINFNPKLGYLLEPAEPFTLPKKMYGDVAKHAARILHTFLNRENNTGAMLEGVKGSGKTLTSRAISVLAAQQGIPTILLTQPFCGQDFNQFLSLITQRVVLIADEFEKTYHEDEIQQQLLTVLDGLFISNKLFVFTINSSYGLNENLSNRPGRIHYWINYGGLKQADIAAYCEDRVNVKESIPSIMKATALFQGKMNFDMVQALVAEVNMYPNDSVPELLAMLNLKPGYSQCFMYNGEVVAPNGVKVPAEATSQRIFHLSPFDFKASVCVKKSYFPASQAPEAQANELQNIVGNLLNQLESPAPAQAASADWPLPVGNSPKKVIITTGPGVEKIDINDGTWAPAIWFNERQLTAHDTLTESYTFQEPGGFQLILTRRLEMEDGLDRAYARM